MDSAVAHAAKGDWEAAIAESGRAHETWESHLRSRAASGAAMDSPMASVDAAVESSLRSLEGTNVSAKEWTPPARAAADSAAAVPPVGTNVAAKEWTPSAATAPPARAAVPPAHPWERVPGGDVNRIFGVVDSFQADSGYLRRARHPTADSRNYDVHFRSRDAPEFERLELGTEVEFTLVDYYGTASATDVGLAAARPAAVRAGGTGSLARPAQRPDKMKKPPEPRVHSSLIDPTACTASPEQLDGLATEVLRLVDAAPSGTVLCANLPRLYKEKYRKVWDLKAYGAVKMSALVSKLPGVHFGGTHRAEVSRKGTGLGVGDDAIDASALAIREETQAPLRADQAERDARRDEEARAAARTRREALSLVDEWSRDEAEARAAGRLEPTLQSLVDLCGVVLRKRHCPILVQEPWDAQRALVSQLRAVGGDRARIGWLVAAAADRARARRNAALRVESWGLAGDPPAGPAPAGLSPAAAKEARRARVREDRLRFDEAAVRLLDAEDRLSGDAAPASAPLSRAAPRPATSAFDRPGGRRRGYLCGAPRETTSAFDGPVAWDELQRRVKAFADYLKLDSKCRRALEAYAVRDADACVRFLRAAPGDLGDHVNDSVSLKDRSKYVTQAISHKHLLAASASELNALTPELRSVADTLALTSDVAKALKKLSLAQQRRAAERLADPGVMFGVLLQNAFVKNELNKKERGCLLRDDLGNGRVDEDLVAALDGFRLVKRCYRSLRDLNRKKQALCALALESMDLSKIKDLSDFIEKGLNEGSLLRKGQELMAARGPMASLVSAAAARAGIRREALPAPRDEDDVPEEFLCPISMEVMTDPVIAADGHTYERRAIEAWFGRAHTSPTTNAPLPHLNLIPAHTIKSLIQRHLEQ